MFNPSAPGDNADLPSNRNILKTVTENDSINRRFLKEYLVSLPTMPRLIGFALVLLYLLMFKVYENFVI